MYCGCAIGRLSSSGGRIVVTDYAGSGGRMARVVRFESNHSCGMATSQPAQSFSSSSKSRSRLCPRIVDGVLSEPEICHAIETMQCGEPINHGHQNMTRKAACPARRRQAGCHDDGSHMDECWTESANVSVPTPCGCPPARGVMMLISGSGNRQVVRWSTAQARKVLVL
jgi:hypothetical protein